MALGGLSMACIGACRNISMITPHVRHKRPNSGTYVSRVHIILFRETAHLLTISFSQALMVSPALPGFFEILFFDFLSSDVAKFLEAGWCWEGVEYYRS